jgi:glycerophosphoryl diester phosphodiesterase
VHKFILFFITLLFPLVQLAAQPALPSGHSHNDYLQNRPLYQAVELGFGGIEIDICLTQKKELKVAHIPWFLSGKKDIEELYFKPIAKMIDERSPIFTYTKDFPLHLLIDFKKNADSTYVYLKKVFVEYASYITQYKNGVVVHKAPLVINITGNKPWKAMLKDSVLFARMDGPLFLTDSTLNAPGFSNIDTSYLKITGRAASNYKNLLAFKRHFKDEEEFYKQVQANIKQYNDHGITTRYYEVPNNEKAWEMIIRCGINWINVDELKRFSDFYHGYSIDKIK